MKRGWVWAAKLDKGAFCKAPPGTRQGCGEELAAAARILVGFVLPGAVVRTTEPRMYRLPGRRDDSQCSAILAAPNWPRRTGNWVAGPLCQANEGAPDQ